MIMDYTKTNGFWNLKIELLTCLICENKENGQLISPCSLHYTNDFLQKTIFVLVKKPTNKSTNRRFCHCCTVI